MSYGLSGRGDIPPNGPLFCKPVFGPTLLNVSFLCVYVSNRNQIGAAIQYLHFELFMFRTRSEENSSGRDKCHCLALLTWLFWKWIWRGTKRACQRLIKSRVLSIIAVFICYITFSILKKSSILYYRFLQNRLYFTEICNIILMISSKQKR